MNFVKNTRNILQSAFKYKRKLKCLCDRNIQIRRLQTGPTKNIDVLFFGTDEFSLSSLRALVGERWVFKPFSHGLPLKFAFVLSSHPKENRTVRKLAVVTSFKSSSNPVKKYANAEKLDCFDWPISDDVCKAYDLGVVVSFGHLIPESIISSFPL